MIAVVAKNGFTPLDLIQCAQRVWEKISPESGPLEADLEPIAARIIDVVDGAIAQTQQHPWPVEFSIKLLLEQLEKRFHVEVADKLAWECIVRLMINMVSPALGSEHAEEMCEKGALEWIEKKRIKT